MSDKKDDIGRDFVLLGPKNQDGSIQCIRHNPDHSLQAGTLIPLQDGKPINPNGQVLQLTEGEEPGLDVKVVYGAGSSSSDSEECQSSHKGPSRVSSKSYLENYDKIFGNKTVGVA